MCQNDPLVFSYLPEAKDALNLKGKAKRLRVHNHLNKLEYFIPYAKSDDVSLADSPFHPRSRSASGFIHWITDDSDGSDDDDDEEEEDDFGEDEEILLRNHGVDVFNYLIGDIDQSRQGHEHSHHACNHEENQENVFLITPSNLHIRSCQHAVHIHCLDRYIKSLHEKVERGEELDGFHAIDLESVIAQFLCPMCKTVSNMLIPGKSLTSRPHIPEKTVTTWHTIGNEHIFTDFPTNSKPKENEVWKKYFEDILWESYGTLELSSPCLWTTCSFTISSALLNSEITSISPRAFGEALENNSLTQRERNSLTALIDFSSYAPNVFSSKSKSKWFACASIGKAMLSFISRIETRSS